jgi:hypothetical protein
MQLSVAVQLHTKQLTVQRALLLLLLLLAAMLLILQRTASMTTIFLSNSTM